jgi:hypothetical protein
VTKDESKAAIGRHRPPSDAAARSASGSECGVQLPGHAMERQRFRVGQAITPEQFEELTDEQLARLVPRTYREFFPGKDFCADGCFYLHDGTAWSFFKAGFLDE